MKVIFGIGNPGERYKFTRHNIGFIIIDYFAEIHNLEFKPSKFDFYYAEGYLESFRYLLVKPTTYVNNSGIAAKEIFNNYDVNLADFLVVTDDVNLDEGKIRIRNSGGDGGHNGIASIIYHLETDRFPRLRFGIGKNFQNGDLAEYVLSKIDEKKFESIKPNITFAAQLLEKFILGGTKGMLDFYSKSLSN